MALKDGLNMLTIPLVFIPPNCWAVEVHIKVSFTEYSFRHYSGGDIPKEREYFATNRA